LGDPIRPFWKRQRVDGFRRQSATESLTKGKLQPWMSALVAPILADTLKRLLLTVAGMAMGFVLPAIAQQTNTSDPQTTQKLRAISKAYDEAVSNNDAAAVGALFTEDAVFVSDRGPIHGRQAIQPSFSLSAPA